MQHRLASSGPRPFPAGAWALFACLLAASIPGASADGRVDWSAGQAVPIVSGLNAPTNFEFAADGSVYYVELAGNLSRFDPSTNQTSLVYHVPNVQMGGERGLVGMALAADFNETGAVYMYYTQATNDPDRGINRLVRLEDGQERLLLTVPANTTHNGGRIVVDPDGNLFVSTGENDERAPAQDLSSPLGKILHVTPEGTPAPGNAQGIVYSRGHRNVYGLALDPETGELWATENSGWRRDEVNQIKSGGNYGYPECEGYHLNGVDPPCPTDKGYTFPIKTFYEDDAVAPTGITFWRGGIYWGSLNEGSIHHLWQDSQGTWQDQIAFEPGAILDLAVGPDDALYFSTMVGIWRLDLPPGATEGNPNATGDPETTNSSSRTSAGTGSNAAPASAVLALAAVAVALGARRRPA